MKKNFMEKYDIENGLNFDYCDNFYKIDLINDNWKFYYSLAKKYYEYHGDLVMPISFRTKNGYDYDDTGIRLGNWISRQRTAYKDPKKSKISIEQIKLLKEIGMIFDAQSYAWLKNYNLAESYYKYHGNLEIPASFKTKDGYNFDEQGINLGRWISNQRQAYTGNGTSRINYEQIRLLEEIGMIWFNENKNQKLQNEIINEQNKNKKQIEILNRVRSYLNTLDENKVYSKEEINSGFVKKLSR